MKQIQPCERDIWCVTWTNHSPRSSWSADCHSVAVCRLVCWRHPAPPRCRPAQSVESVRTIRLRVGPATKSTTLESMRDLGHEEDPSYFDNDSNVSTNFRITHYRISWKSIRQFSSCYTDGKTYKNIWKRQLTEIRICLKSTKETHSRRYGPTTMGSNCLMREQWISG